MQYKVLETQPLKLCSLHKDLQSARKEAQARVQYTGRQFSITTMDDVVIYVIDPMYQEDEGWGFHEIVAPEPAWIAFMLPSLPFLLPTAVTFAILAMLWAWLR